MKIRTLAALALVATLPAVAQANSLVTEQTFAQQREALNTQSVTAYQALDTAYRVETVSGGHSDAANQALTQVAENTQRATHVAAGNSLAGLGQSVAAAQALQNVNGGAEMDHGHVEMTFASLN